MPSYPGFIGPSYQSQSVRADAEILRNWYPEQNESAGARYPYVLLPTPGFEQFIAVPETPIRGLFAQNGRAFFVADTAFYEFLAKGTVTRRGTVATDPHPVTINANGDAGNQLWITSGGTGYIYDLTANTLTVAGVPGTTVSMGGFLSARFLYLDATSGAFYCSALYNGLSWDPLAVAQSSSGDPWRALVVTPDRLIRLLGDASSDCWADQGAPPPMPFTQIQEASTPFGIMAPFAWTVDTTISWLAQNRYGRGVMVRAQGCSPTRISTHAIEQALQGAPTLTDAIACSYIEHGHSFVVFTFADAQVTWAYDVATSLWHQRDFWDAPAATSRAYRVAAVVEAFGKTFAGDRLAGVIYEMKTGFHQAIGGGPIRRVRQPPALPYEQRRITVPSLELVMDTGIGRAVGQGQVPQVMLQVSRDGGQTFGPEHWATAGRGGAWATRVSWTNLGQARNFTPRIVVTDPVPWALADCLIGVRVGTS